MTCCNQAPPRVGDEEDTNRRVRTVLPDFVGPTKVLQSSSVATSAKVPMRSQTAPLERTGRHNQDHTSAHTSIQPHHGRHAHFRVDLPTAHDSH